MATTKTTASATKDRRIVVLTERWVFIGDYHKATETAPAHLTDASCIRAWGTTGGLGEIALKGPTKSTVLDACGILLLDNPAAIVMTIPCAY
jgi:hypothetical protein